MFFKNSRAVNVQNKQSLLYKYQFGFREGYSTNILMITLIDKISQAFDDGKYVLGISLDWSKAFDTANHFNLFKNLQVMGLRALH